MMSYFVSIREFFINNFGVSILAIEINKKIIINSILLNLLRLIPFYFIKKLNVKCIYLIDNLYFSTYSNTLTINPMYLSFEVLNLGEITSVKDNLRKYNYSVPFWFFIQNEKLDEYTHYRVRNLFKSHEGAIEDNKDKLIKDLI
jgi:hypothetical protein